MGFEGKYMNIKFSYLLLVFLMFITYGCDGFQGNDGYDGHDGIQGEIGDQGIPGEDGVLGFPCSGCVDKDSVADDAVDAAKLSVPAVDTNDIDDGAVGTIQLDNSVIQTQHLQNGVITSSQIADQAVDSAKIRPGSVAGVNIAPDAINSSHLSPDSVDTDNINLGAVNQMWNITGPSYGLTSTLPSSAYIPGLSWSVASGKGGVYLILFEAELEHDSVALAQDGYTNIWIVKRYNSGRGLWSYYLNTGKVDFTSLAYNNHGNVMLSWVGQFDANDVDVVIRYQTDIDRLNWRIKNPKLTVIEFSNAGLTDLSP
jgi:hypothetical protein